MPASTVFPTRVLDLCSQDAPITFSAFLPSPERSRFRWLAHGRHSEVFLVSSLLKRTVLKVMPVVGHFSQQRVEAITAAIECYLKLNILRNGARYRAPNFIEVQRVACVFDHFPECLLRNDQDHGSTESLADSLASEIAGTNDCCLTRHFVVFELCYAGKPLSHVTLRSALQGRSLVRQACCCLAVAERALSFRHLGVDADKLLVATTDTTSFEYRFVGRDPLSVDSAGLKAHLAGCLSCTLEPEDKEDDDSECHEDAFGSPSSDCRYVELCTVQAYTVGNIKASVGQYHITMR
ncbi:serine/threonine-protein kinase haspin-like [Dermacentor variabilis]|uniref:serine/threonine-protein kinase haspin-like n=1 Tax=Dermacentor variabilis TaxID=34621 RepID=UPI003F5C0AD8